MATTEIRNEIILLKGVKNPPVGVKMKIQKLQQAYDEQLLQPDKSK